MSSKFPLATSELKVPTSVPVVSCSLLLGLRSETVLPAIDILVAVTVLSEEICTSYSPPDVTCVNGTIMGGSVTSMYATAAACD